MFAHLSSSKTERAPAILGGVVTIDDTVDFGSKTLALNVAAVASGGTVGTCTMSLQGSHDGTTYFALGADLNVAVPLAGTRYMKIESPVPKFLRTVLTPAGGYDASVGVYLRSNVGVVGVFS